MAYYVYLLASGKYGTLYLGVTNDIVRRVYQHKSKAVPGFTKRYSVDKLVWLEIYDDPLTAIAREKELKKWRRDWKIRLIEEQNPQWIDLSANIGLRFGMNGFRARRFAPTRNDVDGFLFGRIRTATARCFCNVTLKQNLPAA
ncbi:putative GIY-YIG superfamily endonuclease [Bradyrhizobium sp. AZCC 1588]